MTKRKGSPKGAATARASGTQHRNELRYSRVTRRMWRDEEFRTWPGPQPNPQSLWQWLLTAPENSVIPGLVLMNEGGAADTLGWTREAFREAFRPITDSGKARYCEEGQFFWLPKGVRHNPPPSPNVIRAWAVEWREVPDSPLRTEILNSLKTFVFSYMTEGFQKAFREAFPKAFAEGLPKAFREAFPDTFGIQEQEQEQVNLTPTPSGSGVADEVETGSDKTPIPNVANWPSPEQVSPADSAAPTAATEPQRGSATPRLAALPAPDGSRPIPATVGASTGRAEAVADNRLFDPTRAREWAHRYRLGQVRNDRVKFAIPSAPSDMKIIEAVVFEFAADLSLAEVDDWVEESSYWYRRDTGDNEAKYESAWSPAGWKRHLQGIGKSNVPARQSEIRVRVCAPRPEPTEPATPPDELDAIFANAGL